MICQNCGKENSPFAKYCENCGALIPEFASIQNETAPEQTNMISTQTETFAQNTAAAPAPVPYQNVQDQIPTAGPQTYQPVQDQMPVAQSMSFSAVQTDNEPMSRYQEITMEDVAVQKKSHKKLIIIIISILLVITLVITGIFVIRIIKNKAALSKIKEQPTSYLLSAYQKTSDAIVSSSDVLSALNSKSNQKTVKLTTDLGSLGKKTEFTSFDRDKMQLYCCTTMNDFMSKSGTTEFYSNLDTHVLNVENDNTKYSYYLNSKDLRQNAKSSVYGPDSQDGFGVTQQDYDKFMDVYEFLYNKLSQKGDDVFGFKELTENICKSADECGKVEVSEGGTEIFGSTTNAFIITHTFNDKSIDNAVFVNLRDWVSKYLNISDSVNKDLMDMLDKMDPIAYASNPENSTNETVLKHYINKDNGMIMKAEISTTSGYQTVSFVITLGEDAGKSDKLSLDITVMGMTQTITINRANTDSTAKYVVDFSGIFLTGRMTYTRDKKNGDLSFESKVSSPLTTSMFGAGSQSSDIIQQQDSNQSFKGNIKVNDGTVTIKIITNSGQTSDSFNNEVSLEYVISNKAEIKELTGEKDILKASKEEIENLAGLSALSFPIIPNTRQNVDDDYHPEDYYPINYGNNISTL